MKNALMLIVILASLAAVYRFLPLGTQQYVDAEITQLKGSMPNSSENINPKKYLLTIPDETTSPQRNSAKVASSTSQISNAYLEHSQNIQVMGEGRVIKVLGDDNQGSQHQRFIVRIPEGFTVLVAHNINLAPRVANIAQGDNVSFYGEYVWNEKGGVMHWTHRDPRGHHAAGWIKHNGVTYQ